MKVECSTSIGLGNLTPLFVICQALWILEGELDSDYSHAGRGTGISWDVNYNKLYYGEACSSCYDDGARYKLSFPAEIKKKTTFLEQGYVVGGSSLFKSL